MAPAAPALTAPLERRGGETSESSRGSPRWLPSNDPSQRDPERAGVRTGDALRLGVASPTRPCSACRPDRESERRQQQELALRLAQFGRDLEVQRRSDLSDHRGFGQFEGRAAEIARQRQMLDYIMRVSAQPPPQ